MAKDDQTPKTTSIRLSEPAPIKLTPHPAEQVSIVPTTSVSAPISIRPKTTPTPKKIAPPRSRGDGRDTSSSPPQQRRPLREEPHVQEPQLPALRTPIGEEVRAQLSVAKQTGDVRALQKAAEAGATLGINDEAVHAERRSRDAKRKAKFDEAIVAARDALAQARALESDVSIGRALHRFREALSKASRSDLESRAKSEILAALGTSEAELELLPTLFFTTVTVLPNGSPELFYEKRGEKRSMQDFVFVKWIEMDGRKVSVFSRSGRSAITLEPTPQIAAGQPIDPPRPKVVLLEDGSYRLELALARYLMRLERSVVEDGELIGEDRWVYYVLSDEGTYDSAAPLIGSIKHGLHPDPCQGQIVMERYVAEPLFAFLHEAGDQRFCYLAVQMTFGNVVVYEVPWSDELRGTESDPLIEIIRGFVPAPEEPIEPATFLADPTSALSSGSTASA